MGLFNPTDHSINLKLVYYGPAFGGKTTNLQRLQELLDPGHPQQLLSVNTGEDTTLFFDYLPLRFRLLDRYQLRVQGYTVPGQVRFDTTRRLVLKGADGVIFVADSSRERGRENRASLHNLWRSLRGLGMDAQRLPVILQYNKRDLACARSLADLERDLNRSGHIQVASSAIHQEGVIESFRAALGLVVERVHAEYELERHGLKLGGILSALDESLEPALSARRSQSGMAPRPSQGHTVVHVGTELPGTQLPGTQPEPSAPALLEGAVCASLELAELAGSLFESRRRLSVRLERNLEQTQRTVHDLRKPLVALNNALFLMSDTDLQETGAPALKMAKEVVGHMGDLLDHCATSLKDGDPIHSSEGSEGSERVVDLGELAEGALRRLSYLAQARGVELSLRAELPRLRGVPEELTSLLSNLISNAIKYSHDGNGRRVVEVTGRRVRAGYLLAVLDNGIGVHPGDRKRIFSKYGRAERTGRISGTGLGLHIAGEIVRGHGGRLGLRSRKGGGSLFYVLLPESRLVNRSSAEAGSGRPRRCRPHAPGPSAPSPWRAGP